jgi:hypothetical protein
MTVTSSAAPAVGRSKGLARPERERVLSIPPPRGRVEAVVASALAELARTYDAEVDKAEETVEDFGLTIEAMRLRDRLARAARTDLQRLLLSTPGVTERLFNEGIAAQVEEEAELGAAVKDESVAKIGKRIERASTTLDRSLQEIHATTQKFQETTQAIVTTLEKVAEALGDPKSPPPETPVEAPPPDEGPPPPPTSRASGSASGSGSGSGARSRTQKAKPPVSATTSGEATS